MRQPIVNKELLDKLLKVYPDNSYEDIAEKLGVTTSLIRSWSGQLRKELEALGVDVEKIMPTKKRKSIIKAYAKGLAK